MKCNLVVRISWEVYFEIRWESPWDAQKKTRRKLPTPGFAAHSWPHLNLCCRCTHSNCSSIELSATADGRMVEQLLWREVTPATWPCFAAQSYYRGCRTTETFHIHQNQIVLMDGRVQMEIKVQSYISVSQEQGDFAQCFCLKWAKPAFWFI